MIHFLGIPQIDSQVCMVQKYPTIFYGIKSRIAFLQIKM